MNLFDIKGRVAVITGGYGVLGSSMARCLANEGVHVVIVGRHEEKGQQLVKELSVSTEALFCCGMGILTGRRMRLMRMFWTD